MQPGGDFQILTDLIQVVIKFLGREVVRQQLLAILLILGSTGLVARFLRSLLLKRQQVEDEDDERDEPLEEEPLAVRGPYVEEPKERPVAVRLLHWLWHLSVQMLHPLLSLAATYGVLQLFRVQGWFFFGLLEDFVTMLWLYLGYRVFVGTLYALFDDEIVERHERKLLVPIAVIVAVLLILNKLVQIETLAAIPVVPIFDAPITLGGLFAATVGFYLWIVLLDALKDFLQPLLSRGNHSNPGAVQASLALWGYVMIAVGLVIVMRVIGLNVTTVAAITGGLSVGVGFALQDVLKNFLGGIILLFEGTVRPGDWVEIGGKEGEVDKISIRSTVVSTFDNVELIVPNQDWLNTTVTTYTRTSRRCRTRVPIGVSYSSDVRQVQEILIETALSHPDILHDPAPVAPLFNFGDSSIDFVVLAWVEDALLKGKVASELRLMIWDAFQEHGIEIPFPQRDLHIRNGLPTVSANGQHDEETDVLAEPVRTGPETENEPSASPILK